jgi:predicted transcriptional regulator
MAQDVARVLASVPDGVSRASGMAARQAERSARRVEALSLVLAGLTYDQIAQRLGLSAVQVKRLVSESLGAAETSNVTALRSLENQRLDRAQAAIWRKVLEGDLKAVETFLRISKQRAALNGLNAATKVDLSVSVRDEMETALRDLEAMVLGPSALERGALTAAADVTIDDDDDDDAGWEPWEVGDGDAGGAEV